MQSEGDDCSWFHGLNNAKYAEMILKFVHLENIENGRPHIKGICMAPVFYIK